jgi:hypothetical protein
MKGRLYRDKHNEWLVESREQTYQLHPDNTYELFELEQRFDFIEGRIAAQPIVEFELVEEWKMSGTVKYAKLKNI